MVARIKHRLRKRDGRGAQAHRLAQARSRTGIALARVGMPGTHPAFF